jgi:ParB family chromosome partitioning protein
MATKNKRTASPGFTPPPAEGNGSRDQESPAMKAVGRVSSSDLVPVDLILEPEHPVRSTMDDVKMEELIDSMKTVGLIQPIILVRRADYFEVVVGHRRLYAARSLKWQHIPAVIFSNKGIAIEAARIHENELREQVNAGDEAVYLKELVERYSLDEAGLAALIKRSPSWIAARWQLLLGDPEVLQAVREGKIRLSVAQELNRITDQTYRSMYLNHAVRSGYSAAVVAEWRRQWELQNSPSLTPMGAVPQTQIEAAQTQVEHQTQCFLCGGYLDPWNLELVYIHRHERAEIIRHMEEMTRLEDAEPPQRQ